ncbi:MAG: glycosyltransferase [Candidatus Altiarchaeales archaeon]|nr:glycosyltransferase [Candidatus Altiarchaeales archaeon]
MEKIAVFQNFLDYIGGAEKVGLTLAKQLDADIYAPKADRQAISNMGFEVEPHEIGWVPENPPLRQQLTLSRYSRLKVLDKYDFIILNGCWTVSAALKHKPNLWYVHSLIREIWDLYEYTRKHTVPFYGRLPYDLWVRYNRSLNKKHVKHVEKIACNSQNTRNRLKKYLKREAQVIYPPVETKDFHYQKPGDYWLSVNRLITHKRVQMQLEAFRKMPKEKLVIVGCFEDSRHFRSYNRYLEKIKPANVEIVHSIPQKKLVQLYAACRGLITTSRNEDFGLNAVEAMASGKPVIAPNEGGYRETVVSGETGVLIDDVSPDKIREAVEDLGDPSAYRRECVRRAEEFDTQVFTKKIRQMIT